MSGKKREKKIDKLKKGFVSIGGREIMELQRNSLGICGWLRIPENYDAILYNSKTHEVLGSCALTGTFSPCINTQLPQRYGCCSRFIETFPEAARLEYLRVSPRLVHFPFDNLSRDLFPERRKMHKTIEEKAAAPVKEVTYSLPVSRISTPQRVFKPKKINHKTSNYSFEFRTFDQLSLYFTGQEARISQ